MLTTFAFQPSFYCTQEFDTWWKTYHAKEFLNVVTLTQYLTDTFSSLQQKFNNGRAKHIKEIQDFQKNFETVYDSNDLSQTIREAAVARKEKMMLKFPNLRISDYVKDKYTFALNFYPLKFPPFSHLRDVSSFRPSISTMIHLWGRYKGA